MTDDADAVQRDEPKDTLDRLSHQSGMEAGQFDGLRDPLGRPPAGPEAIGVLCKRRLIRP